MKISNLIALLIFIFILIGHVIAQPTPTLFATYNGIGNGDDIIVATVNDNVGNVYVTGYSYGGSVYGYDYVTIKYDSRGSQIWLQRFNSLVNGDDYPTAMAIDGQGNIYVTGKSHRGGNFKSSDPLTNFDYVTIKYANDGTMLWLREYDGGSEGDDQPHAIAVDNSGNVYVTGESQGNGSGYDCVTIKYDPSGLQLWAARYNNPILNADDKGFDIALDNYGFVYVTGYTTTGTGNNSSLADFLTLKYYNNGRLIWSEIYDGGPSWSDTAKKIQVDNQGNVYVTGVSKNWLQNIAKNSLTLKYDANGSLQWYSRIDGALDIYYTVSMALDQSQNLIVLNTDETDFDISNYATFKYGSIVWTQYYLGHNNCDCEAGGMVLDQNNNIYETGVSDADPQGVMGITTIKYDQKGQLIWQTFYQGPPSSGKPIASSISTYGNQQILYVGGASQGFGPGLDFILLKYDQSAAGSSLQKMKLNPPIQFELKQNNPNPFNPNTNISFSIPEGFSVKLKIFDVLGKLVDVVVNKHLEKGVYSVNWDGSKFSSGLYFYSIEANGFREVKKMLLTK